MLTGPSVDALAAMQGVPTPDPDYLLVNFPDATKIGLAAALGLLMGIEREWSQKPAGLRTFTIISTLGAATVVTGVSALVVIGGLLVVIQGSIFAAGGLFGDDDAYLLTTSVSMVLAYVIGVLAAKGFYFESVLAAVVTTLLLVLRRELHGFAHNLERAEIRSAVEFAVIAFVIYPLLPSQSVDPWDAVDPQTVWLLIMVISVIGFVNYLVVARYGAKGIAITSFFGGLVNSAAVIGEIVSRTRSRAGVADVAVGAVLLANAAMAVRDLFIVVAFVPELALDVGAPLVTIVVVGIVTSYVASDWDLDLEIEFESPFNLRTALKFGGLFLAVLVVSATAKSLYGTSGFLVSSFFGGMVSSGAVTTSVVLLVQSGGLSPEVAAGGIIAAVSGSIFVKLGLVVSMDRSIARPVTVATSVLLLAGVASTALTVLFIA